MLCSRRVAWSIGILTCVLLVTGWAWYRATRHDVSGLIPPAISAAKRGDYPRAISLLDQILQRAPQHGSALLYRAQIAREQGQIDLALQLLQRVPDTQPQQAGTARFFEGSIHLEANRASTAERLFLRSIELHPTYLQPRERLVQLYLLQLRGRDLRRQLEAIQKQRSWSLTDLVVYHGAFGKVNRPDVTIPILQRYFKTDPAG